MTPGPWPALDNQGGAHDAMAAVKGKLAPSGHAIVFDVFGVLLSSSFPSGGRKLAALLKVPLAEIQPAYVHWEYPWDRGQITDQQFWYNVQHDLGTAVDWQLLNQAVLDSICPLPGALQLLDRCGLVAETYLLSDTRREWFEILDARFGLRRRVRQAFLSYQMGFGKAEDRCFEHVLAELACPPARVIFLDDRAENVERAQRFGIRAIRFEDAEQAAGRIGEIVGPSLTPVAGAAATEN